MHGRDGRGTGGVERAAAHARQAGQPQECIGRARRLPLPRYDTRVGAAGVARRARATSRARPLAACVSGLERWRCSVASTRRARSSPSASGSRGARRETRTRDDHRQWVRPTSSSWPAMPPPLPSSGLKGAGNSRNWGNGATSRPRTARVAQALYELDRLDEADAWAGRASGSSARATTRDADAFAAGRGQRCSRAAASTPRRNASPARQSRSARRRTISTGKATRTPTSPRCSCSAARPARQQPRSTSARTLRAKRKPRHGPAGARPAGGFSGPETSSLTGTVINACLRQLASSTRFRTTSVGVPPTGFEPVLPP